MEILRQGTEKARAVAAGNFRKSGRRLGSNILDHRVLAVLSFCLAAVCSMAETKALHYPPGGVTLRGKLVSKTFYGPPNYGENPESDTKKSQYILILDSPVEVIGDKSDFYHMTEKGVKEVTVVVLDFKAHPTEVFVGKKVEVEVRFIMRKSVTITLIF